MDLQYLLDLEEIRQLRINFSWFLESSQPDALADLFTEDGVIDVGPWGKMVGQHKIRKGYGRAYGGAEPWTALHAVTNPRITINGDEAEGTWYLLDCVLRDDTQPLKIIGVYEDRYRKVDGVWKMSHMHLRFLWSADKGRITPDNPMEVTSSTAR